MDTEKGRRLQKRRPQLVEKGKAFSERSEDFSAARRRESNGIFAGCRKSP